ncbi:hypothetical protein FB45DRAFT_977347 [Roridomyces roridus]|uniref:Uncharacterized protein n=1 Tax=Roridomyces roridus TaxID=1738132 RepID=A0AAD7C1J9_9AGAR|nr:hypothetical protein FB45DRAFT_977347 [Roridomyces roridus]
MPPQGFSSLILALFVLKAAAAARWPQLVSFGPLLQIPIAGTPGSADNGVKIMSKAEMKHWLATTDAALTFIGEPIERLDASPFTVTVTYCSGRIDDLCTGPCTAYTGDTTCLDAPNTQCLSATANVGFCDSRKCKGSCNVFDSCGTKMQNNFCATHGTKSISVPPS